MISESDINLSLHLILVLLNTNQQHHGYSDMLDIYNTSIIIPLN